MPIYAILFLGGIYLAYGFAQLTTLSIIVLLLLCLIALITTKKLWLKKIIYSALLILIAYGWALLTLEHLLAWQLPKQLEYKPILIKGIVHAIPEQHNHYLKFLFLAQQFCDGQCCLQEPALIQLSWYGSYPQLAVGTVWQLAVKLKRPHGVANPGGFNKAPYFLQQHVRAVGTVLSKNANNKILADKSDSAPIAKLRQHILKKLEIALAAHSYLGFIEALTLGVRQHISVEQWQLLRATGTSHLMAISGLHIGLVAGIVYKLIIGCWQRLNRWRQLALLLPIQQLAAFFSLMAGLFYSLLAGFSIPTQRSLIMLVVLLLLLLSKRTTSIWQGLSLALFAVLIWEPLAVISASFWLSFGAVSLILYGASQRYRANSLWWRYGRVQWVVSLGLLPLSLLFFQQSSLISFLANLFAIPYLSFLVLPLALLGSLLVIIWPWLGTQLLQLSAALLSLIFKLLGYLAEIKFLLWHQAINSAFVLWSVVIGVLLLLMPRGFPARWLGIVGLLPLFFTQNPHPELGELWLSVLDVGQGLAVVIRTQHHTIVYDTGPKYGLDYNAGDYILIPYLRAYHLAKIDTLIISHGDSDHSGGAEALLAQLDVKHVISSVPERYSQFAAQVCQAGLAWQWDNVQFEFIAPPLVSKFSNNNRSCVLSLRVGPHRILLPGDIEKAAENYLLKYQKAKLAAEILVAPHHGSNTSSTIKFVEAVKPSYVVFSTGYLNRFGFPKTAVVTRYQALGATLYNTADCGMVSFKLSTAKVRADKACYRQTLPAYQLRV